MILSQEGSIRAVRSLWIPIALVSNRPTPLVLDARVKPHHAPLLEEDPEITRRVDALAAPGGPLHGVF